MQTFAAVVAVLAIIALVIVVGAVVLWLAMTANGKNPFL